MSQSSFYAFNQLFLLGGLFLLSLAQQQGINRVVISKKNTHTFQNPEHTYTGYMGSALKC